MIKLLAILMLLSGSVPVSLLEELAIKSRTLAPIVEVADLYFSAGILDYLPLRIPVVGGRVSSPYGYRKDPLTGKGRFHAALTMPVNCYYGSCFSCWCCLFCRAPRRVWKMCRGQAPLRFQQYLCAFIGILRQNWREYSCR
mgnify:CR=1 FL=1